MFIVISASAQNLQKLADDNGYGGYYFGDSLGKYESKLKFIGSHDVYNAYEFINKDQANLMIDTIKCYNVGLYFNSIKKLQYFHYTIFLSNNKTDFIEISNNKFASLKKYFILLYGNEFTDLTSNKNMPYFKWQSEHVTLEMGLASSEKNNWRRIDIIFSCSGIK